MPNKSEAKSEIAAPALPRPCDAFINNRGLLLSDIGFTPDPGKVERGDGTIVFYHYTRAEHLEKILAPDGGLWARLNVPTGDSIPEYAGHYLVEGLLEPLPKWVTASPYFGDLGLEMMRVYIGNLLLRVELPDDYPGLFVIDWAHQFECKHLIRRGRPALNLGYDCSNGREVTPAFVNSLVPMADYRGGHVAPEVECIRRGEGIAIPSKYISVADEQPLKE